MSMKTSLADRIRSEAATASRPGQMARLEVVADEVEQLEGQLDQLRKALLAEWEKDRKTYAALMEKPKEPS